MGGRKKIGVEGDEFCIVVDGGGGDDQVQGACIESLIMAFLAEPCGIAPDGWRRREDWHGGELSLDLRAFLRDGVAEDLENDRLAEDGGGIENPWLEDVLERRRRLGIEL